MNQSKRKPFANVNTMSFEECYQELESLVEQFEQGRMSLSESVARFERGMELMKRCSTELNEAEKKISTLLTKIDPVNPDDTAEEIEETDYSPISDDDIPF